MSSDDNFFRYRVSVLVGLVLLFLCCQRNVSFDTAERNKRAVLSIPGLVAFWDFETIQNGHWSSQGNLGAQTFPVFLSQIGDSVFYGPDDWPYHDNHADLQFDYSGPFGHAARFNRGYIYGVVPRKTFEKSQLDLCGYKPFTMVAWIKFIGERHMVAGIWDEGGWQKYSGRRQVALFAGLFDQRGVIGHVSMTGAASFPQSKASGSQYARIRAIDSMPFEDHKWVAMAMVYDPIHQHVKAYLNGTSSPYQLGDPVTQDVYRFNHIPSANPLHFEGPIYCPDFFVVKFNGYLEDGFTAEHRLLVNLSDKIVEYQRDDLQFPNPHRYRVFFDLVHSNQSQLSEPLLFLDTADTTIEIPIRQDVAIGDRIVTALTQFDSTKWIPVGDTIKIDLQEGAPFTFGRALGLASEEIDHGSQLLIDGVAVFNRVLTDEEIRGISFITP